MDMQRVNKDFLKYEAYTSKFQEMKCLLDICYEYRR